MALDKSPLFGNTRYHEMWGKQNDEYLKGNLVLPMKTGNGAFWIPKDFAGVTRPVILRSEEGGRGHFKRDEEALIMEA